jgi:hypothetical protein
VYVARAIRDHSSSALSTANRRLVEIILVEVASTIGGLIPSRIWTSTVRWLSNKEFQIGHRMITQRPGGSARLGVHSLVSSCAVRRVNTAAAIVSRAACPDQYQLNLPENALPHAECFVHLWMIAIVQSKECYALGTGTHDANARSHRAEHRTQTPRRWAERS